MNLRERERGERGERERERYRGDGMDVDDDSYSPSAPYGDFDRRPQPSRHQGTEASVPTSSYTYAPATTQATAYYDRVPRTATTTTPDPVVARPALGTFGPNVHPANTQAPWQQPPAATAYVPTDPRTGLPLQAPYPPSSGGQYQDGRHKQR
jgi:hypothetical protein